MSSLIKANFNGIPVFFQDNAYLNATGIAQRFSKQPRDYLKSVRTKEYIDALVNRSDSIKTKLLIDKNQLVIVKKGASQSGGGTWLHPKLAIDFARWLSADFAVWCDEQIEGILHPVLVSPDKPSTHTTRAPLKQAVGSLVSAKGMTYRQVYEFVRQRFGVRQIEHLSNQQVTQAVEYVHSLHVSVLPDTIYSALRNSQFLVSISDGVMQAPQYLTRETLVCERDKLPACIEHDVHLTKAQLQAIANACVNQLAIRTQ